MKKSGLGSLNTKDFIKGLLTTAITAILAGVYTSLSNGHAPLNFVEFQPMLLAGGTAGVGYVLKNLGTNSEDKFLIKEPAKPEATQ